MSSLFRAVAILLLCGTCFCKSGNIKKHIGACASTQCAPGYVCREQVIYCFVAPCPSPMAVCRKIVKPGVCPAEKRGTFGICLARCTIDADCTGNFKCCGNCPRTCKAPAVKKIGKCPRTNWPGPCIAKCTSDGDCPGRQLCCGSCPRKCQNPVVPWPRRCHHDWQCTGWRRKCCRGRCQRKCFGFPWPLLFSREDDK